MSSPQAGGNNGIMWSSLKQLIRQNNERCIIVEDGQPKYVLLTFEEYQHLQNGQNNSIVREYAGAEDDASEAVNGELQDMDDMDDEEERDGVLYETVKEDSSPQTIKIEDLPF